MARTKGSANLAASLEILAEAPVDARTVVAAESDLTVAANFPYAYVGMPVYVKATQKMHVLTATPVTTASNWKEVGSGGSSLPSGGTTGQALVKHSNTDQDVEWATINGNPNGGTTGQLLAKHSNTDGDVEWVNAPSSIPDGGTTGQVLAKHSNTDKDVEWAAVHNVPAGGTTGQVLTKNSDTDYDSVWGTPSYYKYEAKTLGENNFTYNNAALVDNGETRVFFSYWGSGTTSGSNAGLPDSGVLASYDRHYYIEMTKNTDGTAFVQRCRKFYTENNTNRVQLFERRCTSSGGTWTYSDWIESTADTSKFYSSDDTAFTDIADGDYVPVYDTSASTKKKSLWSNIKSVLKTYFDSLYALTAGSNITISNGVISATSGRVTYSTTEQRVGTWIDGKPLYQKTIDFGALPNNTTKNVAHGISNIKYVPIMLGTAYASSTSTWLGLPTPHTSNVALNITVFVNSTNVSITTASDRSNYSTFITIQYTKTTD